MASTADLHVHMNYGGHYRNDEADAASSRRDAEDLDVDLQPHRQQGAADSGHRRRSRDPRRDGGGITIFCSQEYHTSFWGHLGLLHLRRYLTPDFSAYQHSALSSPYPHNGVIADHGARAGRARRLRASVRHGARARARVDHECVARRRRARQGRLHRSRRIRGPQGDRGSLVQAAEPRLPRADRRRHRCDGELREPARTGRHESRLSQYRRQRRARRLCTAALKQGRTFASNGPQLALEVDGKSPGDTLDVACRRTDGSLSRGIAFAGRHRSLRSSCRTVAWSRATG